MKQVITTEYSIARQQLNTGASSAEKKCDTNGSLVSNGHLTVNGRRANDDLIGSANDHVRADGHAVGRNHVSMTDTAYPAFSKTATVRRPLAEIGTKSAIQNAEVCAVGAVLRLGRGHVPPDSLVVRHIQKLAGKIFKQFKMPIFPL